jgi:uncharacterized membrane protein YfcA
VIFFVVAFLYATVGFGGGSAYLAVLAMIGLPYQAIPQVALVCNLIVSGGGVWHFNRGGHYDLKTISPFMVLSVPMAYVGGYVLIGQRLFMILLGASLFAAGIRMCFTKPTVRHPRALSTVSAWSIGLPVGAALGLLAGMVGIGGGIFLAPVLLLSGWTNEKQTAAAASLFIFLNSAAGLIGQFTKGVHIDMMIVPLALAVFFGGQIGR